MQARRIFETVLYAPDLAEAARFYHEVFGLEVVARGDLVVALRCGDGLLLLFDPERSSRPGREVPSHGAVGPGHIAFLLEDGEADAWRRQLAGHDVEIEREVTWADGGRSIYVRDPAGNSVELAPPTLWGGGW